jgi:hypothetical protein
VALLDRQPPPAPLPAHLPEVPDIRVSTVTPSSAALLRAVGAWRPLAVASAPFSNMQAGGRHRRIPLPPLPPPAFFGTSPLPCPGGVLIRTPAS